MPILENTSITFARLLAPVPPFDSPQLPTISSLDLLGALRLSIAIRQLRRQRFRLAASSSSSVSSWWWHDLFLTMVIVFGGEMIAAALLTVPPSFMISPTVTLLFIWSHTLANALPDALVPNIDIQSELPLSLIDAMTRSMLVCDGVVSLIKNNPNPLLRVSPMALLITSTLLGNGGFFLVNIFGMLSPTGWTVSTPPELGPYGWTTTDLWVAPLASAIFATLTHVQPFWAQLHLTLIDFLGKQNIVPASYLLLPTLASSKEGVLGPLDVHAARSICALFMAGVFASRAVKTFWGPAIENANKKTKTMKVIRTSARVYKEL